MLVPPLDTQSHKRKTHIFQKKRYSPEKVLENSRRLHKLQSITNIQTFNNQQKKYKFATNNTLPVPLIESYHMSRQNIIRLSPNKRIPLPSYYLPQPRLIPQILPFEERFPLHAASLPIAPIIPHPIDPILIDHNISELSSSPIIREAPSTYFELSQRILGSNLPIGIPPPILNPNILERSFSGRKYRDSPSRDFHIQINQREYSYNDRDSSSNRNKNIGTLVKDVYLTNTNNTNVRKQYEQNINNNNNTKIVGESTVSFGGNQHPSRNNKNPYINGQNDSDLSRQPNQKGQQKPRKSSYNFSINQKAVSEKINIKNSRFSNQLLNLFKGILLSEGINIPEVYPQQLSRQWIQVLKQCQNLSNQRARMLIQQRIKKRRLRQTEVEEEMLFKNTVIEQFVGQMNKDKLKFQRKIATFNNEIEDCHRKMQEINKVQRERDRSQKLQQLANIKEGYVGIEEEFLNQIDNMINKAQNTIKPVEERLENTNYHYFQ